MLFRDEKSARPRLHRCGEQVGDPSPADRGGIAIAPYEIREQVGMAIRDSLKQK